MIYVMMIESLKEKNIVVHGTLIYLMLLIVQNKKRKEKKDENDEETFDDVEMSTHVIAD